MRHFAVVYRMGTPDEYKWARIGPLTQEEAKSQADELTDAGFFVLQPVWWGGSLTIGLPDTFAPNMEAGAVTLLPNGWRSGPDRDRRGRFVGVRS